VALLTHSGFKQSQTVDCVSATTKQTLYSCMRLYEIFSMPVKQVFKLLWWISDQQLWINSLTFNTV